MLRRLLRWLLEIPTADELEARRRLDAERDGHRTSGRVEASRSNLAGGKGSGTLPRDWPNLLP